MLLFLFRPARVLALVSLVLLMSAEALPGFAQTTTQPITQPTTQTTFVLRGVVRDGRTREALVGATVSVPALGRGTATDDKGAYELALPADGTPQTVRITFLGYEPLTRTVKSTGVPVALTVALDGV